ncbi:MAG: ACT domain-containing protein [Planctomycetes bacterium]|nr:ACT domain-containing protein [Planctomycetota bacterium]
MARRFLTADDVRREHSGSIVVEADTIVTPQAQETARELGKVISTTKGPYVQPTPDRGPDADKARRSLPNLPEPADGDMAPTSMIVTAVGKNRPGVLAELTSALAEFHASVHDISQRVVDGYFHLILVVETPQGVGFGTLKQRMECLGGADDYAVRVMHERVFRFMHRV